MIKIRDAVTFVDQRGVQHDALVTEVFGSGPEDPTPAVNVVFVHPDSNMDDSYGRQVLRETSVVHQSNQTAHGFYWTEKP